MRFSTITALALPALATAIETQDALTQAKDTALHYLEKASSYIPHFNTFDAAEAAAAKADGKTILGLNNWKSTLRSSVQPGHTEEWWVLLTGGNKTCFGRCEKLNAAFNETANLWKKDASAPHLAYVNCDHQPILCNSWASGPPTLYIMDMTPEPEPVVIHTTGFNASSVDVKTFTELRKTQPWKKEPAYEGYFHPFNGQVAQFGAAAPLGWLLFVFSVLPNWLFMILISMGSRRMM
jgi:hypothetical protein